jgi:hypothetical protein
MSTRAAADMIVAVPSKGRAGKVKTQAVIPSCHVYVPALEAKAYVDAGTRNVVKVPDGIRGITRTRNWILANTKCRRVVMIDDDVRDQGYRRLLERQSLLVELDEATWLGEFRKLFEITEDLSLRIWGTATQGALRAIYPYNPFRFRSAITASCMGIINDGRTLFDESYPVKEDYELCARCIKQDGAVVVAQYLFWHNSHWFDPGGCKDYRTHAMERDCIRRLCKAYPGIIRATQRQGNDYAVEVIN